MGTMTRLLVSATGRAAARRFERAARDSAATQQQLLTTILQRNRETEYGRTHNFGAIQTLKDYAKAVPIITYENVRNEIDRMTRGEHNILTAETPIMFARTSGTTGKPKYIPVTPSCQGRVHSDQMRIWLYHALCDHPTIFQKKVVSLVSRAVEGHTPDGTPYGSTSGTMYRDLPRFVRSTYSIPYPVFEIDDYEQKYYCLLRVALEESVTFLATANPSSVVTLCEMADQYADDLLRDIADGTVRDLKNLPAHVREALGTRRKPLPERAKELESARSRRDGRLLAADYWPDLALIACWKGGTVGHYLEQFDDYFNPDGERPIPVRDWGYLSSEARGSIPLSDDGAGGVLTIASNVFEFVPVEQVESDEDDDKWRRGPTLGAHELEEGQSYYTIITTTGGLYRYDINDVVQVVGRHLDAPVIAFVRKGNGMTSITGEKLSAEQVVEAFERSAKDAGVRLAHFKAEARPRESRYALMVEFDQSASPGDLKQFLQAVDKNLSELNLEYAAKRKSLRLKPPLLNVMKSGWHQQAQATASRNKRIFQAKAAVLTDRHDDREDALVSQAIEIDGHKSPPKSAKQARKEPAKKERATSASKRT